MFVRCTTWHCRRRRLVEKWHRKIPEIEQSRVDATAILEVLENPPRRLFGKAAFAGAPDDHGNDGHVLLSPGDRTQLTSASRRRILLAADSRRDSRVCS